jgi:T5SS/PEP-CTERM-associated repeat protein
MLSIRRAVRVLVAAIIVSTACTQVQATVRVFRDVIPADNPATPAIEGLPSAGNGWNAADANNAQSRWEDNEDIIVGQKLKMGGRLEIDANSALRYQDLIIGDMGEVNGIDQVGNGVVLITGEGSLYSNDPNSIPPGLPADFAVIPADMRALDVGFDLIVGRWGNGELEIRDGGAAEIQDAVIIGENPGSFGRVTVDGFGSLLANGGFEATATGEGSFNQMIVGLASRGELMVRNGGMVVSQAPQGGDEDQVIGAVIGSTPYIAGETPDEAGGEGLATVMGAGSRWVVGGSLQVGGFHDSVQGAFEDVSGENAIYSEEAGTGTLRVQDNGVVFIRPADSQSTTDDTDLVLAIGRFGRVELTGGTITMDTVIGEERGDNVRVMNDGVITGTGRINTGIFRNRYFGVVSVDPGQSLIVQSTAEVNAVPAQDAMVNFGVIRVHGTVDQRSQIEFERAVAGTGPASSVEPFRNKRIERPTGAPLGTFFGGLISAKNATLIFRSDIENTGLIEVFEGTNYIVGDVINIGLPTVPFSERGIVRAWGTGTKLVLENDYIAAGGTLSIAGGATFEQLQRNSFVMNGDLIVDVGPSLPTPISTVGDVGIHGGLHVNLVGVNAATLIDGASFEIISFGGDIGGVDLTNPLRPEVDLEASPLFTSFTYSLSGVLPAGLVLMPQFLFNSVVIAVESIGASSGPDFNGDGVVDQLDLAIWQMNKGITMGATVLQGDANGDGAVNGEDYIIWLEQFTMGPGAGGGSEAGSGTVPEPTGLIMLAMGGLLAMVGRRGRRR